MSQCLIVPGKLQTKAVLYNQGVQGDEGGQAQWESIIRIKSRPTWVTCITVVKFFMDNTPLRYLNLGPPNLCPSSKAKKWQTAVPSPNAEPEDYQVLSVLVLNLDIKFYFCLLMIYKDNFILLMAVSSVYRSLPGT